MTDLALPIMGITDWTAGGFTSTGFTALSSATTNCLTAILYANSTLTPAGAVGAKTVSDSGSATGNNLCYQQFALRPAASATKAPPPYHRSQRFFRRMSGLLVPATGLLLGKAG